MKNKILSVLLISTMLAVCVTGCGAKNEEGGSAKNSITILVESGSPAEDLANNTAADFEEETGCKVDRKSTRLNSSHRN